MPWLRGLDRNRVMLGVCLGALGVLGAPAVGWAQVFPFEAHAVARGRVDAAYAANALVTCDSADARCQSVRNGEVVVQNTQIEMRFVDADPLALGDLDGDGQDDTRNASAAWLDLPAGARVEAALLYVGGIWSVDNPDRCGEPRAVPLEDRTRVLFAPPAADAYLPLDGALLGADEQTVGAGYAAIFDVSEHVTGAGDIWVADVALIEGSCAGGGWALGVVYRTDDGAPRSVALAGGYARVNAETPISFTAEGLLTPGGDGVAATVALGAFEGDRGLGGDFATLADSRLSDAANPVDDLFNSSISRGGVSVARRTPAYVNNIAFDFDTLLTEGLVPGGAREATIGIATGRDIIKAFFIGFSVELAAPEVAINKAVIGLGAAPDGPVDVGDRLQYTLEATADPGNADDVIGLRLSDLLPPETAWVAGSIATARDGAAFEPATDVQDDDGADYDPAAHRITVDVGRLAPGERFTARFEVEVLPSARNRISNSATAAWQGAAAGPDLILEAPSDGDLASAGTQPTMIRVGDAVEPDGGPGDDVGPDGPTDGAVNEDGSAPVDAGSPTPDAAGGDAGPDGGLDGAVGRAPSVLTEGEDVAGGLAFGCRAAPGAQSPSGLIGLLALGLLLALGTRRARAMALALALAALTMPGPSRAGERFDAQSFAPTTDLAHHGLRLVSARPRPGPSWSAGLLLDHADDPLVVEVDGQRTRSLVGRHTRAHLLASGALTERLELGLAVPVMLDADGDAVDDGPGVGDLRVNGRYVLWNPEDHPETAVALAVDAFLGTGDVDAFHGDGLRLETRIAAAHRLGGGVDLRANLGWQFRDPARLGSLEIDDLLTLGLGADIPLAGGLSLLPEINAAFSVLADAPGAVEAPIEAMLAARWTPDPSWVALIGAGTGIVPGAGVPDWRVIAGFGFTRVLPPSPVAR